MDKTGEIRTHPTRDLPNHEGLKVTLTHKCCGSRHAVVAKDEQGCHYLEDAYTGERISILDYPRWTYRY